MIEQHAATRKSAFWIASVLGVLLLAIHVVASTHVTHYDTTDLGLLTKLPTTFWIGLSCLGALLYVSRKSERRTVIVVTLISFYLFGIPVLIRENKAESLQLSYNLSSQGVHLLSEGQLALNTLNPWDFRNWPGFFYFTAFISSSTGIPAPLLCDYFPLLTIALLGVITYSILRLQLNTLYSSFGALWFIASFWTGQHYFCPQSIAYVIYSTIILLLAKLFFIKKQSIAFPLSIIFLFAAAVVSHLLTSFVIVVGLVAIYASCKILPLKVKMPPFYSIATCILLASIFFSYHVLVTRNFSTIIEVLYEQISQQETHLEAISKTRIIGSTSYLLELVGTYSITIINVVIAISAILKTVLGLLFHRKGTKDDIFWIAWIIVAGILGISMKYGEYSYEAIQRAFMFMLIPTCYFSIKFLNKKPRILILVLIILIFIHIPACYSREMHAMVPTSELKGIDFCAEHMPPTAPFFYSLPTYKEMKGKQIYIRSFPPFYSLPSHELVNETTGEAEFIISSKLQKNYYLYFLGVDLLENLNSDGHHNRIYDNEGFCIYARAFLSPHS